MGKGGRLRWLFMFWSTIEIKTKPIIQIQACKFLQIQRLETEIISLLFVSESGKQIEQLGLISTLMCR